MKSNVFLVFVLLFSQISYSQWTQQISNTTINLNDVFFISNDSGWAVGDNGEIITTIDGGANWIKSNAIPTCNLYSIFFTTPDSGWIAGTCGIHFTSNGGLNWILQSTGNGKVINDIFFYNSLIGWAVGNNLTIMRTTDGGKNWTIDTLTSTLSNNPLLSVYFRDSVNGWIGGGVMLHFTNDGGKNWTQGSSLLIDWIYSLDFGNEYIGVGAGMGGSSTNTFDWGKNWNFSGSVTPNSEYIYGVNFSSVDSVYIVGEDGLIYFSNNSGSTWTAQTSGVTDNLNSVYFPSSNVGYAVGNSGNIIKYDQSVAINDHSSLLDSYKIYPNPATKFVTIEPVSSKRNPVNSISLRTYLGQVLPITTNYTQNKIHIDLRSFAKGVYILEIKRDNNSQFRNLIIKY